MNEHYATLLTRFPLLEGFTVQGAEMLLECGEIKDYAYGELVIREGDPGTFAVLILEGKLQVFVRRSGQEVVLRDVDAGVILGELAVLCDIPRIASVRAIEKTTVVRWSAEAFRRLLLRSNLLQERVLGQTLRNLIDKERSLVDLLAERE
jgi:CRP-like cAMP-binding protein